MIKAVFFDWMNTLTHAEPDRHEQFCQIARELGVDLSPQKVIRGIYAAGTQLPAGAPYRWQESHDPEIFIHYLEIILAEAGVKLPRDKVLEILSDLGLAPYVDFVVTAKEVGANKPEPPIFLAALECARVGSSEAVYVGDQYETDVVGARGVGIDPVLIDRYDLLSKVSDCPRIHSSSTPNCAQTMWNSPSISWKYIRTLFPS